MHRLRGSLYIVKPAAKRPPAERSKLAPERHKTEAKIAVTAFPPLDLASEFTPIGREARITLLVTLDEREMEEIGESDCDGIYSPASAYEYLLAARRFSCDLEGSVDRRGHDDPGSERFD